MVQDALDRIRVTRKLTTVTVAHRLSTIVHSDQIAVIADGSIQELGTHKELIEEGGIYATLCEGQGLTADAATDTKKSSDYKPPKIQMSPNGGARSKKPKNTELANSIQGTKHPGNDRSKKRK